MLSRLRAKACRQVFEGVDLSWVGGKRDGRQVHHRNQMNHHPISDCTGGDDALPVLRGVAGYRYCGCRL
jgi:hypothetical protein